MAWDPLNDPIDYFKLSGVKSPGIATVAGIAPPQKWDVLNGYGQSGARLKFIGSGLATWDCTIELYTSEEHDEWASFKKLLDPPPSGMLYKIQRFWHPFLAAESIDSCVVTARVSLGLRSGEPSHDDPRGRS